MSSEIVKVQDIQTMAQAVARSGLFGMKTVEQAMALMLIAQAEGRHPASAAMDYNIIQNRPALKADAMLARFQAAGGKVEWHDYTDAKVSATFSHPQGGAVKIEWDDDRVKMAKLDDRDMHKKYPRQMKRSRVISEGIRAVYPGVAVGMYTVEEVQDFDAPKTAQEPIQEAVVVEGNGHDDKPKASARKIQFLKKCEQAHRWMTSHGKADEYSTIIGGAGVEAPEEVSEENAMLQIEGILAQTMRDILAAGPVTPADVKAEVAQ